jgi:hypothetical protein
MDSRSDDENRDPNNKNQKLKITEGLKNQNERRTKAQDQQIKITQSCMSLYSEFQLRMT